MVNLMSSDEEPSATSPNGAGLSGTVPSGAGPSGADSRDSDLGGVVSRDASLGGVGSRDASLSGADPNGAGPELQSRVARTSKEQKRGFSWRTVGEVAGVIGGAVLIALFLRAMVVQVYKIPSESMTETLSVGSRIAVNRVPVVGKQVHRGDVVVFRDTEGWLQPNEEIKEHWYDRFGEVFGFSVPDGQQIVVKRVIGVGGDTITCCDTDGRLMVNGVPVEEGYLAPGSSPSDTEFEITVPEDSYWVMGDNRQNSADSSHHAEAGDNPYIPASSIIGKAEYVIWPFSELSQLHAREAFGDVPSGE